MIRLLNFTRTQERKRGSVSVSWKEERGGLYSSGGENMNRMSFNEG